MPVTFDFAGKVVLVTGVSRAHQIGAAVARAFGQAGARLVLADVNAVGVAERAAELAAEGLAVRPAAGDLTQPDVAQLTVETALAAFGQLDIVVNVAGGLTTYGPVEQLTPAALDRELAINLRTAVIVTQAALPELVRARGAVVNFASIATLHPAPHMAAYTAAKAAVVGFTRGLAAEMFARGVRVNAVAPAMVRTADNVAQVGDDARYVEMRQLTDGILFLASDAAAMTTGHVLPIAPAVA